MTDYISRQAAKITARVGCYNKKQWETMKALIDTIPAAEVVEVVRCHNCKNWHEWENGTGSCKLRGSTFWFGVDGDDYCSFGERADDECRDSKN